MVVVLQSGAGWRCSRGHRLPAGDLHRHQRPALQRGGGVRPAGDDAAARGGAAERTTLS
jgi:hypothetical protein